MNPLCHYCGNGPCVRPDDCMYPLPAPPESAARPAPDAERCPRFISVGDKRLYCTGWADDAHDHFYSRSAAPAAPSDEPVRSMDYGMFDSAPTPSGDVDALIAEGRALCSLEGEDFRGLPFLDVARFVDKAAAALEEIRAERDELGADCIAVANARDRLAAALATEREAREAAQRDAADYWPYVEMVARQRPPTVMDCIDAEEMLRERKIAAIAARKGTGGDK